MTGHSGRSQPNESLKLFFEIKLCTFLLKYLRLSLFTDTGRPFRKHPKFSRGRGRGRRGHFRGRWNGGRNRRGHRGKRSESSQGDVNGGLSQSLGAIAIQQ